MAEVGSTVRVFDGTVQIGTTVADASGAWSFATGTLADGSHAFTSKAADAAGNVSVGSSALNVVVDTVAPNAPDLVSDTVLSANTMVISGTAEAGSAVKLYEGTTLLGTGTAASSGAWSINVGSLAAGPHNLTATATDVAGNTSQLSSVLDAVAGTVIEAAGTTALTKVGSNFYVSNASADALLKFNGAVYVAGQFGTWSPIGAEATPGGYEVAWKDSATGLYTVWSADSNGNFISNLLYKVSGTSASLESIETTFHQDLNGDGVIGLPNMSIEAFGATSLVQSGGNYFLEPVGGGNGPTLKFGGAVYVAGQFGTWSPIGGEATPGGYEVAWKDSATGLYTVWSADSNGAFISDLLSKVSGTSPSLESIETTFHQDLNGDGVIGLVTTTIDASGATSLVQGGNTYFLDAVDGGNVTNGVTLKFGGAVYVAGQFGTWSPIGGEATSGGYVVAWKDAATGLYTVWSADSNGNFISNLLSKVSGTSTSLESIETTFHQDLNGDGVINTPSTVLEISGKVVLNLSNMTQAATIDAGATLELSNAASGSITFKASTGNLVLDHASQFTGTLIGLTGDGTASNSNQIDLKDIAYGSGTSVSFSGNTSGGVLTVVDAQNHAAHLSLLGDYTHSTFNLSNDGSGGTLVIDPPKEGFDFAPMPTPQSVPAAQPVAAARLGSDGFVFGHADLSGSPDSLGIAAIDDAGAKWLSVADSIRSEVDPGGYQPHPVLPADVHLAEFHNFMLHQ
jgi:hypothetical protein